MGWGHACKSYGHRKCILPRGLHGNSWHSGDAELILPLPPQCSCSGEHSPNHSIRRIRVVWLFFKGCVEGATFTEGPEGRTLKASREMGRGEETPRIERGSPTATQEGWCQRRWCCSLSAADRTQGPGPKLSSNQWLESCVGAWPGLGSPFQNGGLVGSSLPEGP